MSPYVLRRRQLVRADLPTVFRFFEDPWNLERITPRWLRFEITGSTHESMRLGTEIDYRLTWQRLRMRWRSRISEYEPCVAFADEMITGPYRRWCHRHLFAEVQGGVEMVDIVEYELPLGALGRLAHGALVRGQLEAIFDFRRDAIAGLFAGGSAVNRRLPLGS